MQLIAMLSMLIDHIGLIWFPDNQGWRIIGRLALPFYAYALVVGYARTRSVPRYLLRLAVIAAISQLPYQLAFGKLEINVVCSLLVCLLALVLLDRFNGRLPAQLLVLALSAALLETLPFSYGAYALLLVLIYRYARQAWMVPLHLALNVAALFYRGWLLQLFSLLATLLLVYMPELLRRADRIAVPRLLWRSFYPLHLAVIAALVMAARGALPLP